MDVGYPSLAVAGRSLALGTLAFLMTSLAFAQPSVPGPLPLPPDSGRQFPPAAPAATSTDSAVARPVAAPVSGDRSNRQIGPVKLRNETVDQVLDLLENWTGRILLRPPALPPGNYTLTLDKAVDRDQAVRALETLLNLNGIAVTPLGENFLKVTALNLARTESPLFIDGPVSDLPPSGQIATKLFSPKFLRVAEFLPQISALLNPGVGAAPVLFEKANAALVTDSVSNLQRVEALLERLDRPFIEQNTTKFYTLKAAKASEVVTQIRAVLSGPLQMQLGAATTYHADDRTNQIILVSDARQQPFFDDLIAKLDIAAAPNTRNEVIPLKNATAKEVAALLSQLVQGRNTAAKAAGTETVRPGNGPNPGGPPSPQQPQGSPASPGSGEGSQEFSELLTILADDRSNALIVSGLADDIELIRELVAKVDVLLPQVRIEVVIAEVTLNDEATSGISALGLRVVNSKLVGFSGSAAGVDVTNGTFTNAADGTTQLSADISLVTTPRKNNTTILSVPTIITTHNKEGSIFVGEQRPVISSYLNDSANTGTIGNGYRSTVTSKDIGIELVVKPLIGIDGSVQLEIKQEVNDILGDILIDGNLQPRIGRRSTKSFISVKSGETIVLGGLQRNSNSKTTNRLGPIPILGDLLGTRKRANNRTDLVFFLRPYVLTNTTSDNIDALRRIDIGPQREAVRSALDPDYVPDKDRKKPRR
jgi:general secretion pathway protein D